MKIYLAFYLITCYFIVNISCVCHSCTPKSMFLYGDLNEQLLEAVSKSCSEYGSVKEVEKILKLGANVDATQKNSDTILMCASWWGNEDLVKLLVDFGANVNAVNNRGEIPLHFAAQRGFESIVRILIKEKSKINARSNALLTPLHLAAMFGHMKAARILLENGADPTLELKNRDDRKAHQCAALTGHTELSRMLEIYEANMRPS